MQSLGGCGRLIAGVFAALISGAGCGVGGGTLAGAGGSAGTTGGSGGHSVIVGTAGAGATITTGAAGSRMNCAAIAEPASKAVPDIVILLDTSASMNDTACGAGCSGPTKWAASVDAINTVVDATKADVNWGLIFIGDAAGTCDPGVGTIVGLNASIKSALETRTNGSTLVATGNRPTRAAVSTAMMQLSSTPSSIPRAILLITDGTPNCREGAPDVQTDDATGAVDAVVAARTHGVNTLVVGLSTAGGASEGVLDDMALSGGYARAASPPYFPAFSSVDLIAAMDGLVASTTECTYLLPPPPTDDGTTTRSDIDVRIGDQPVPRDDNNGWSYTDASMTAIQFNGPSCELVKAAGGSLGIIFPCILI